MIFFFLQILTGNKIIPVNTFYLACKEFMCCFIELLLYQKQKVSQKVSVEGGSGMVVDL